MIVSPSNKNVQVILIGYAVDTYHDTQYKNDAAHKLSVDNRYNCKVRAGSA